MIPRVFCLMFAVLLALHLTSCFSRLAWHSGQVRENLVPRAVWVGSDGLIAIEAQTTYYRETLMLDRVPQDQYTTRRRFILLHPSYVQDLIQVTSATAEGVYPIPSPDYALDF